MVAFQKRKSTGYMYLSHLFAIQSQGVRIKKKYFFDCCASSFDLILVDIICGAGDASEFVA